MNTGGSCVDAYPFLAFSDLNCHLRDTRIGISGCTVLPDSKEAELGSSNKEASPSAGKKYRGSFSAMFAHGCVSLQLFPVVWIFLRSLGVICYNRWVLSEGQKLLQELTACISIFNQFTLNELWPYYQKHVNQIILNCTTL